MTQLAVEIVEPHWELSTIMSTIMPRKWSLNFKRTDDAALTALDLKQGKEMTCYMGLMENFAIKAVNKGVMLRWKAETVAQSEDPNKLSAEQDDSAMSLFAAYTGAALAAFSMIL